MSDLFLRRVELANFRVYGDSFALDFDPEPGVTLIVGANGLGKTTLFDGIEWALTGEVSRFSDIPVDGRRRPKNPLTRIGQPDGSHRVALHYSDGAPIDRGKGLEPTPGEVIDLLRRPSWTSVGSLNRYLMITHFLGQSASMRFSVRKPSDQWEALKGPAGVDRINFVKERIGGQAARRAFTRVIQDATAALEEAKEALKAWTELLAERDRLQQLSVSEDALNPQALAGAIRELAVRLVQLTPGVTWDETAASESPETLLGRLAALVSAAQDAAEGEGVRLQALQGRTVEFTALVEEIAAVTARVSELERRDLETAEGLRVAEASLAEAERALAAAHQRAAQAQARLAQVARAVAAAQQLRAAEAGLREIDAALEASDKLVAETASRRSELGQSIADAVARVEERRRVGEQLSTARRRRDLAERWRHVRAETERLTALVAGADADGLRGRREELVLERQAADDEIAQLSRGLRQMDERASAIAAGVAAIAAHLSEHDTDCPVCASRFKPGELMRRAQSPPDQGAPKASELAEKLAAATVRRNSLTETLRTADAALSQHIQALTALTQQKASEEELLQQLAEAGAPPGAEPDRAALDGQIAALEASLQDIEASMALDPTVEELRESDQAMVAEMEAESARRAELARRRAEHLATAETARGALRQSPDLWSASAGFAADLEAIRKEANDQVDRLAAEVGPLRLAVEAHRQQLEALRQRASADSAALKMANARLGQASIRRQELVTAWTAAGMSGEPEPARLTILRSRAEERAAEVARLGERQKQLSAGYRRWTQDEALAGVEARIQERLGDLGDTAVITDGLKLAVGDAERRLQAAQRARVRMDEVVALMQKRADAYAESVLQPLNKTISRFSRALLNWSDAAITYSASHLANRSELRLSTVRTTAAGDTTELDINPNHYFSEGQLSALSVSALLAASTTFRWSRWPALLMDDPLQHNDVIHASAFMDLMGQLVRRLGYQVIMSTHDSAEADFLVRKCQSAKIPLRVHQLRPSGDGGLVSAAA